MTCENPFMGPTTHNIYTCGKCDPCLERKMKEENPAGKRDPFYDRLKRWEKLLPPGHDQARAAREISALEEKVETLESSKVRLQECANVNAMSAFKAEAERDKALGENERLREALEFYADPWEWQKRPENEEWLRNDGATQVPDFYSEMEFGDTAKAALEGGKT